MRDIWFAALYSSMPSGVPGVEPNDRKYRRQSFRFEPADEVKFVGTIDFDIGAGTVIVGFGIYDRANQFLNGGILTPQSFGADGTYRLTVEVRPELGEYVQPEWETFDEYDNEHAGSWEDYR